MERVYVASSWRNEVQPLVVQDIRLAGHEAYDFKGPEGGFSWREVDANWQSWNVEEFERGLDHPAARQGFKRDWDAMEWATVGVLVLPCGRSAHLEAGYFVGAGKPLIIAIDDSQEPELMYKMATRICRTVDVVKVLKEIRDIAA